MLFAAVAAMMFPFSTVHEFKSTVVLLYDCMIAWCGEMCIKYTIQLAASCIQFNFKSKM